MSNAELKSERLVARATQEVQRVIQEAAALSGATVSQFMIDSAMSKAREIKAQAMTIELTSHGAKAFFDAIENPPAINNRIRDIARRHKIGQQYNDNHTADSTV